MTHPTGGASGTRGLDAHTAASDAGRAASSVRRSNALFWALGVISGSALLVRAPAIAQPLGIDQGIFATAAWGLQSGLSLYRDLWDQKPPGIHLIYRAGFAVFGASSAALVWLDLVAAAAVCAALVSIGRRLRDARAGWTAGAIFAVLTIPAARYQAGGFLERAVPETFITAFIALALCAALARARVTAGLLLGAALTLKPTAIVYAPLLLFASSGGARSDRGRRPRTVDDAARILIGAIAAPALVVVWLWLTNASADAWTAVVRYNRAYVDAGPPLAPFLNAWAHELVRRTKTDPSWVLGAVGSVAAAAHWIAYRRRTAIASDARPEHPFAAPIALLWLASATLAAGLNGIRFYNSYFMPMLPPLAMSATWALAIDSSVRPWIRRSVAAIALGVALTIAVRHGWLDRAVAASAADLSELRAGRDDGADRSAYFERFGGYGTGRGYSARANDELTQYVIAHVRPVDRIFIFGMAPSVYFEARRLPAVRLLWVGPALSGFLPEDDFTPEGLAAAIRRARPGRLIIERHNRDSLLGWSVNESLEAEPLRSLLGEYTLETEIEDFLVYSPRALP